MGTADTAAKVAARLNADAVIVASTPQDDSDYLRRLSWELEGTASELVLSSPLGDVAGPRMTLKPVEGLPLIQVEIPTFEGGRYVIKRAMDMVLSAMALVVVGLITPFVALAIKMDDGGPVFFRQERVGRDGQTFRMVKFRSMRVDAEAVKTELAAQNEVSGPMFKMKRDPRITRVGAILRKYSIDELPQFWNVLIGDMSIVGPRPPLPSEVTTYDGRIYRRLYIKPGITGLWQISGRSDLQWDETVRLDLRYVENWSVIGDLVILWRTVGTVLQARGAY
jgi:exopolysaccharide biosynthesis polyprenyl glycosylphosphotransferase